MKRERWSVLTVAIVLVMGLSGCNQSDNPDGKGTGPETKRHEHNLNHLKCPSSPVPDQINVAVQLNADILSDDYNLILFPCEGDTIQWTTASDTLKITVNIQGSDGDELFGAGNTTIVWDPKNPGTGPKNQTPPQIVQHVKKHSGFHKYKIEVEDVNTHEKHFLDPHIIPMGK